MASICEGRVAVVTGAGRGIGRGHALELARQGARVVVNDLGGDVHGANPDSAAAKEVVEEVVEEIVAAGGEAVASGHDVATADGAAGLVRLALDTFGALHAVVNNAGILRDRTIVNMTEDEWDSVLAVHLRGTFLVTREAARHWRERSKAGEPVDARIINTSSVSGLFGNTGQSNYGAAKAGIAGFTIIASLELARYGITVNAVSPSARTRMITPRGQERMAARDDFDPFAPGNIAPLVAWLAGAGSKDVTGRVFNVHGGRISVLEGWREGPVVDKGSRWDPSELAAVMPGLVAKAAANVSLR